MKGSMVVKCSFVVISCDVRSL